MHVCKFVHVCRCLYSLEGELQQHACARACRCVHVHVCQRVEVEDARGLSAELLINTAHAADTECEMVARRARRHLPL